MSDSDRRFIGKRYESDDWPENLLWAEVLEIEENLMLVWVKTEHGGFEENWKLPHFKVGLRQGFYREIKRL